jgi:soluble lytic murein transglycosylase-like protein
MMWQPERFSRIVENQEPSYEAAAATPNSAETENIYFFTRNATERQDFILELYRDPRSEDRVVDFFAEICASRDIAEVILANAEMYDIPPALAVALAWEESRFDPHAVNTKNRDQSIDRGLFQLNDRSFPRLEIQSFFNPWTNARYGMNHLRYCLDTGGSEIAALAMYNAGAGRVNSSGTPRSTLDYISRIMNNRSEIEGLFHEREAQVEEEIDVFVDLAEAQPERPRLVPLIPLAGR